MGNVADIMSAILASGSQVGAGGTATPAQVAAVTAWLDRIGETDDRIITDVLARCRRDPEALAYFLMRSDELLTKHRFSTKCADLRNW